MAVSPDSALHARRRLILFAKAPVAGQVKTRLTPPLSPSQAASLAEAFLRDEVATFETLRGVRLSIAYSPRGTFGLFRRMLGDRYIPWLSPQPTGDLGQRLLVSFASACPGWWPVVVVGADTPDLPAEVVRSAFAALEETDADVVIGPTVDGGYYLIGARQPHSALFEEIPWSTDDVLAATLARAEREGLKVHLLPLWEDIDTMADLGRLRERLATGRPECAPATRHVLSQIQP